ncbi:MAG: hypothetical protein JW829_17825 [Pirellulales bacterium]|nr:hypothetical protein [Pirellulales bacterium]
MISVVVTVFFFMQLSTVALAVAVEDMTGTKTAPSDDPGWAAVTNSGKSAIYLGDSWVLSALHLFPGAEPKSLVFDAGTFQPIAGNTSFIIPNPSNWGGQSLSAETDLFLFRVNGFIDVPAITIASTPLTEADLDGNNEGPEVVMMGNGWSREASLRTWWVDTSAGSEGPWEWSESYVAGWQTKEGYKRESPYGRRWGTNRIADEDSVFGGNDNDLNHVIKVGRDVVSLITVFNKNGTQHEAQGLGSDSGGPVFSKRDGQWELRGIMNAVLIYPSQWDADHGGFMSAMYGNATTFADLSVYHDAIQAIIDAHPNYSIIGDINLDGLVSGDGTGPVESDDLSAFIAGWRHEHPLANIEAWKQGDLNLDGITDLYDFALLRDVYPSAGAIAGRLNSSAVPEPSSAILTICIGTVLAGLWHQWKKRSLGSMIGRRPFSP